MAALAITMFIGITVLAHAYGVIPSPSESGVSQLGRAIFGNGAVYYLLQAATMLILVLAANTAYADFPRLASIVARDRYLPRQFMNQGDRLAFSNGILVLSAFAAILIIAFHGDAAPAAAAHDRCVHLAAAVAGGHGHPLAEDEKPAGRPARPSTASARSSRIVLVIGGDEDAGGAWIVILLIPLIVLIFKKTRQHYDHVARQLTAARL
jgi:hypothetical protein